MIELILLYILTAGSFSISSLFFIHIPATKYIKKENTLSFSISYLIVSFIYFPKFFWCWLLDSTTLKKELYANG